MASTILGMSLMNIIHPPAGALVLVFLAAYNKGASMERASCRPITVLGDQNLELRTESVRCTSSRNFSDDDTVLVYLLNAPVISSLKLAFLVRLERPFHRSSATLAPHIGECYSRAGAR